MFSQLLQGLCDALAGVPILGDIFGGFCTQIISFLTSLGL